MLPIFPTDILNRFTYLRNWCVLHTYRGSIAHGMHNPSEDSIDDIDTLAVVIPPIDYYFGLKVFGSRGTQEISDGRWDIVVYDFIKLMGLLKNSNPNVLVLLWSDHNLRFVCKESIKPLFYHRKLFSTKLAYNSFAGYAQGQLIKMKQGQVYAGYMGAKRKALVGQFGYDPKNAAHAIRLLRMAHEFFENDGVLFVDRREVGDADELLAIKCGEWELPKIVEEAETLFARIKESRDACNLPEVPDDDAINDLCVEIVMTEFETRGDLYTE